MASAERFQVPVFSNQKGLACSRHVYHVSSAFRRYTILSKPQNSRSRSLVTTGNMYIEAWYPCRSVRSSESSRTFTSRLTGIGVTKYKGTCQTEKPAPRFQVLCDRLWMQVACCGMCQEASSRVDPTDLRDRRALMRSWAVACNHPGNTPLGRLQYYGSSENFLAAGVERQLQIKPMATGHVPICGGSSQRHHFASPPDILRRLYARADPPARTANAITDMNDGALGFAPRDLGGRRDYDRWSFLSSYIQLGMSSAQWQYGSRAC